ncbi:AmmeMemoRadiSam system protein B, partial [Candidatus Falkowbacteria bacterium]|nr:AmmeMemoRadiSam system protein B [Candidatus Falkowbacteria bacterium]
MNLKSKTIVFSITLLSLSQVGLLYLLRARPAVAPVKTVTSNSDLAVSGPEESGQIATESADPGEQVKGGIVPHHLMVRDQLAAYFKAFDGANYDSVVIIGPNHFSRGDKIITTDRAWPTASGKELVPDISMINELGIEVQNEPFTQEHSIGNLVSFVKDAMPKAKIVPIILRIDTTQDEAANLAENLAKAVAGKKTLVLASVDFSHYQQVAVADLHDMASRAAIDNFELGRIYGLEIDSPPSIYALLKYLSLTGAEKGQLKFATNSGRLAPATADNTTSHNFYYFYPGKAKTEKYFSGLFFGDIMIDRHVGERIKSIKVDGLIKSLAGDEKRFLMGTDIVSANLEGAVTDAGAHYAPQLSNDFAFAPSNVQVFKQYGFNFFNMANNHLTDQGGVGLKETEKNLTALSLNHSGCPDKAVGDCTGVIEQYGNTKVAMLGFSMVYGDFDLTKAKEKVSEAKKQADF